MGRGMERVTGGRIGGGWDEGRRRNPWSVGRRDRRRDGMRDRRRDG